VRRAAAARQEYGRAIAAIGRGERSAERFEAYARLDERSRVYATMADELATTFRIIC
jgi:hypothetical protein